jgi:hypothetical protein
MLFIAIKPIINLLCSVRISIRDNIQNYIGGLLKMTTHIVYEFGKFSIKCGCLRGKKLAGRERGNSLESLK